MKGVLPSSIFFCSTGILLLFIGTPLKQFIIDTQFTLTEESFLVNYWKESPPFHQEIYIFNWTNPDDVYSSTIEPYFQEVGPFQYDVVSKKNNIIWNKNETVTFEESKFWYYKNGSLSDKITTIDTMILMAAYNTRNVNYHVRRVGSYYFGLPKSLSITGTASELLFEGYSDFINTLGHPFLSGYFPTNKVGFFYQKNGTVGSTGVFNYATGLKKQFPKLYTWNYKNRTQIHPNEYSSYVFYSIGDFYRRPLNRTKILFFFEDICRVLNLQYIEDEEVNGILGYKFSLTEESFKYDMINPEAKCYSNKKCSRIPFGVFNVTGCRSILPFNVPLFASLPHFHLADPYYTTYIEGLKPNDNHNFSIIIEPETGIPLKINATLQMNMMIEQDDIWLFENLPGRYFMPIFWFRSVMEVPYPVLLILKIVLQIPLLTVYLGSAFCIIGLMLLILKIKSEKEKVTKTETFLLQRILYRLFIK